MSNSNKSHNLGVHFLPDDIGSDCVSEDFSLSLLSRMPIRQILWLAKLVAKDTFIGRAYSSIHLTEITELQVTQLKWEKQYVQTEVE